MIKSRRSLSRRFRRYPLYKQIDSSITAKFEVYGILTTSAADNTKVVFKSYYNATSVQSELTNSPVLTLITQPSSNVSVITNYSFMSLYAITFEVFPNKYNGNLPGDNPILFGLFKNVNPSQASYTNFYTSNTAFPVINSYQKRYFVINSPYYNLEQWNSGVPNYHIMLRQYSALSNDNGFTSQTFKLSVYCRLRNAIN